MKRYGRFLPEEKGYFVHVMSRVVNRDFILGEEEKEFFRKLMWRLAEFSGVQIVTYVIMDNHFHILCQVPENEAITDEELYRRLGKIHDRWTVMDFKQRLERFKGFDDDGAAYRKERQQQIDRMCDLGQFMKSLKQRFTRWYNKKDGRRGTLWEARYKHVLVESGENPLLTMATYIDLNPVRAGLCEDPKDYRWCGYGEALGGSKQAREGLKLVSKVLERSTDWRMVNRGYRIWLFGYGQHEYVEGARGKKRGFDRAKVQEVIAEGGELSREELLRCRVRYFSDGLAIGSKGFVESIVDSSRSYFGKNRKSAGGRMKGGGLSDLYSLRNLQDNVFT